MEEDTWNKIIDIRVNGSLSPFQLSYFLGMEPSSPFDYIQTNYNHKMKVIKKDIFATSAHPFLIKLPVERKICHI